MVVPSVDKYYFPGNLIVDPKMLRLAKIRSSYNPGGPFHSSVGRT
jgi:hypothetical protein